MNRAEAESLLKLTRSELVDKIEEIAGLAAEIQAKVAEAVASVSGGSRRGGRREDQRGRLMSETLTFVAEERRVVVRDLATVVEKLAAVAALLGEVFESISVEDLEDFAGLSAETQETIGLENALHHELDKLGVATHPDHQVIGTDANGKLDISVPISDCDCGEVHLVLSREGARLLLDLLTADWERRHG